MTPPTEGIDNVWGFLAFVVFAVIVGTPGLLSLRSQRKTEKKTDQVVQNTNAVVQNTNAVAEAAATTQQTLTTNNGGSHVKDQLDRMERGITEVLTEQSSIKEDQNETFRRLDNLEHVVSRIQPRRRWFG